MSPTPLWEFDTGRAASKNTKREREKKDKIEGKIKLKREMFPKR